MPRGRSPLLYLSDHRALWPILDLHRHGKPLSLTKFANLSDLTRAAAHKAALAMQRAGFAKLDRPRRRGPVQPIRVRLTDAGHDLGDTLDKIERDWAQTSEGADAKS
jgi:hypothetical protein